MDDYPLVAILFLTYKRTEYALASIRALKKWMVYPNLCWYVADSGGSEDHWNAVVDAIGDHAPMTGHSGDTGGKVLPPGKNWNFGIQHIEECTQFYLRLEDDFEMLKPLDLIRYVKLLQEKEDVGMVRFSNMPVGLEMESVQHAGHIYMNIYKTRWNCYSGNPGLMHSRFHRSYGYFNEKFVPGDCEVALDVSVCRHRNGPQVWWPVEMGEWGAFGHIGRERSY